jgi:hypothetical protein
VGGRAGGWVGGAKRKHAHKHAHTYAQARIPRTQARSSAALHATHPTLIPNPPTPHPTPKPNPPKGLDYLSSPSGAIAEAQALAAAAFGADRTFFLVNGATAGVHAAVVATCPPGSTLLLARNCHLSAVSAAALAGCRAAWAAPGADARHGVAHGVAPDALAAALAREAAAGARVGAVLVVSPTYFGVASRVEGGLMGFPGLGSAGLHRMADGRVGPPVGRGAHVPRRATRSLPARRSPAPCAVAHPPPRRARPVGWALATCSRRAARAVAATATFRAPHTLHPPRIQIPPRLPTNTRPAKSWPPCATPLASR